MAADGSINMKAAKSIRMEAAQEIKIAAFSFDAEIGKGGWSEIVAGKNRKTGDEIDMDADPINLN